MEQNKSEFVNSASSSSNNLSAEEDKVIEKNSPKPQKLTQSTLAILKPTSQDKLISGGRNLLLTERVEQKLCPTWMKPLLPYFETISSDPETKKYTMMCLLCRESNAQGKMKTFVDKCAGNFERHLKRFHLLEYEELQKNKTSKSSNDHLYQSVLPLQKLSTTTTVQLYDRHHPRQKAFDQDLLDLVTVDMLPFTVVEGSAFRNLISRYDNKISFPHPTTIERRLSKEYEKCMSRIKAELGEMIPGSLHFIMDMWTSPQKQSIMGLKVQYIKNWKIKQLVVGFKHFPESHTAENIRDMLRSFLIKDLGLGLEQIGTVTADNASNILAAFRIIGISEQITGSQPEEQEAHDEDRGLIGDDDVNDSEDRLIEEAERLLREELYDDTDELFSNQIINELGAIRQDELQRNGCLAHLIQLAIRDTINGSSEVKNLAKKITDIVRFFNNSNKYLAELREKSGGLSLVKPCVTRWNSLYYCLKRILRKDKGSMKDAINEVLGGARSSNKRTKVPPTLYEDDVEFIQHIVDILEPWAKLTNELQADSVTSSLVILGVINAIRETMDVKIDSELRYCQATKDFQSLITSNMVTRLASKKDDINKRKIVTVNVFENQSYIVSSCLDSRIKTTCFKADLVIGTPLEGKVPTEDHAVQVLRRLIRSESRTEYDAVNTVMDEKFSEPPKKRSMFSLVSSQLRSTQKPCQTSSAEVDEYLQIEIDSGEVENICPLNFWSQNHTKFPMLSKLAIKFLAMPATSAGIERLFSVANAVGKARSARLTPLTIEKLLCVKFHRLTMK